MPKHFSRVFEYFDNTLSNWYFLEELIRYKTIYSTSTLTESSTILSIPNYFHFT